MISSALSKPAAGASLDVEASAESSGLSDGLSSEYQSTPFSNLVTQDASALPVNLESLVSSLAAEPELTIQRTGAVIVTSEISGPQTYDTLVTTGFDPIQSQDSRSPVLPVDTAMSFKISLPEEVKLHVASAVSPWSTNEAMMKDVSSAESPRNSNARYTPTTSHRSELSMKTGSEEPPGTPQSTGVETTGSLAIQQPNTSTAPTPRRGPANDALDAGDHGTSSSEKRASIAGTAIGVVALGVAVGFGVFFGAKRRQKRYRGGYGHMASSNGSGSTLDFRCAGTDSHNTLERSCSDGMAQSQISNVGSSGGTRERVQRPSE